jgi:hypothetical protein
LQSGTYLLFYHNTPENAVRAGAAALQPGTIFSLAPGTPSNSIDAIKSLLKPGVRFITEHGNVVIEDSTKNQPKNGNGHKQESAASDSALKPGLFGKSARVPDREESRATKRKDGEDHIARPKQ